MGLGLGVGMSPLASATYYARVSSPSTYRSSRGFETLSLTAASPLSLGRSIAPRPDLFSAQPKTDVNPNTNDVELISLSKPQILDSKADFILVNDVELKLLQPVKELVIIDAAVEDKHVFYNMSRPGIDVVEIEFKSDSLDQLSEVLSSYQSLDALHLVSHAKNGVIQLGEQSITEVNLKQHVRALASIDDALKDHGDLLIYGCELASGSSGEKLLELIANQANVDVAASNNKTGSSKHNGDWELEIVKGNIETDKPFSDLALKDFTSILPIPGTVAFSVASDSGAYDGANTINASYTNGGYTIIADGADVSTQILSAVGRIYSGAFGNLESQLTLSFSGNETFNASSLYLYNSYGAALSFTVTSDVGGDSVTTSSLASASGTTVDLTGFDGITKLYITPSSSAYWDTDNLVMDFNINSDPTISIDVSTLAFTEGDGVTQVDSAATLNDADGDADWNGGTLVAQITANNEAADQLSIPDNVVGTINTSGTNLLNGGTTIGTLSASEGTVTSGTALTITFNGNATNALVQQTLRAIHYNNSSSTPGTSNRTVTFIATDTNAGSSNDSRTISVTDTPDSDGSLTASGTVTEPVNLDTTVDTVGEAVDVFDFTLSDGGSTDGLAMTVSQVVVNVSGTTTDTHRNNITWRLNGNDVANVTGVYSAGGDTITFSGLSISIADGASETYTVNAYFNDNTGVTEDDTFILSVDGDTDLTVGGAGTQMSSTTAVTNGSGGTLDVTATVLAFTTQPAGSISGSALSTQPVVAAQDAFGNTDVNFSETVTVTEASAGSLTNNTATATGGIATFSGLTYSATADQQSFILTANDQDGVGSNLPTTDANSVTSDVVATLLVFDTQPVPLSVDSGVATSFTTVPVVSARNAMGVVDIGYSTDITLAEVNGAGSATLTATGDTDGSGATVSITPSSGVSTFTALQITYTASGGADENFNLQASSGGLSTVNSSQLTGISSDADADVIAGSGVSEPVAIDTTVDTVGESLDIFDFTISDGGTSDGKATSISEVRINTSGTVDPSKLTYRLNGPDASNVSGNYSGGVITFSGLTLSIADGGSETYTINAYYNDNTGLSENQTLILSVDGDTDLTVNSGSTRMGSTAAVNNSTGSTVGVTASALAFTTQPAGSVSGSALSTQPVVTARDAFGNTDVDFAETITLTESSAGSLTSNTAVASSGVASFSGLTYTATADQQSFTLTANDQNGVGSDLPTVDANSVISDVVATQLVFATQPAPLTVSSGVATNFTTVPVVSAQDGNGVVDTGYSTAITLAEVNGAGSATMSGTGDTDGSASTVSIIPGSGVSTYTGLQITYTASGGSNENFNLQASSGGLSTVNSSQLTAVVNSAPVITSSAVTAVDEDAAYTYTLTATDADSDPLTYSAPVLPAWLNFNTGSGLLSGTPTNDEVGNHNVTLRVNDGTVNVDQSFTITVSNTNDAPTITSSAITGVNEDSAYTYTFTATDVDVGDSLTYSALTLPSWLNFNSSTGVLMGTPTNNEVGDHNVSLRVNDGTVNVDQNFTITVSNTNDAPIITSSAVTSAIEDSSYSYTLTATDEDLGDTLTLSSPVLPTWLNFNAATGVLSGTPLDAHVGGHNVTLRVNDGSVDVDQSFVITVTGVNDAPTGEPVINGSAIRGQNLSVDTSTINDEDGLGAFSYQWQRSGLNILGATTNSYTLVEDDIGQSVRIIVSYLDGGGTNESLTSASTAVVSDIDSDGDGIGDLEEGTGDADGDGIPNYLDDDSDGDGILDKDEGNGDSDGDAIPDYLDSSSDEDGDGIPDIYDGDANTDTDGDGTADVFDTDSDNDGIPDFNESNASGVDTDGDTIDDAFDVDQTGGIDANADGIDDGGLVDTDMDGVADAFDRDSDNDFVPDALENSVGLTLSAIQPNPAITSDFDGDGVMDYRDKDSDEDGISDQAESRMSFADSDNDQIIDAFDVDNTGGQDVNLDGVDDSAFLQNSDSDLSPDMFDLDSDNDGITDVSEAGFTDSDLNAILDEGIQYTDSPTASDADSLPDYIDLDSNDDGIFDIASGGANSLDENNDGEIDDVSDTDYDGLVDIIDEEPQQFGTAPDRDHDGIPASIDLDDDGDGIADLVEGSLDTDQDGLIDSNDVDSDGDGLPDRFEADRPAPLNQDVDKDGIDDRYDVDFAGGNDANGDGVSDLFVHADTDSDGQYDFQDTDSDNDGISDTVEQVLVELLGADSDSDGLDDAVDVDFTGGIDANGDGMDDSLLNTDDLDNDGILAFRDADTDGDGILDADEDGDFNQDGINDRLQAENNVTATSGSGSMGGVLLIALALLLLFKRAKNTKVLLLACLLMPVSFKSQASDNNWCWQDSSSVTNCLDFGMGAGLSEFEPSTEGTSWLIEDDSSSGQKLYLGIDLKQQFFAELAYAELGKAKFENLNPLLQPQGYIKYSMTSLSLGYRYQESELLAFQIKGGWAGMNTRSDFTFDENDNLFAWGVGSRWTFSGTSRSIGLEYERFGDDISLLSMSLIFHFK